MRTDSGSRADTLEAVRPNGDQTSIESDSEDEAVAQYGSRRVDKLNDPTLPTKSEIDEHEKSHLPFRSWCRHCVYGRGIEAACKESKEEPAIPEIHVDFMFMGEEAGGGTLAFLVVKERKSGALMASVVPSKSTGEFIARRVVAFMKEVGCAHGDINIKSDNEEALVMLVNNVARQRAARGGGRSNIENSPRYSSKSNGVIERGVRSVQGHIRTLRSAVEARLGIVLDPKHAIYSWIAEYSAYLINRGQVGKDGKTPYERCKGKRGRIPDVEFFEAVLWKRKAIG